jgi:hypothetical protein
MLYDLIAEPRCTEELLTASTTSGEPSTGSASTGEASERVTKSLAEYKAAISPSDSELGETEPTRAMVHPIK